MNPAAQGIERELQARGAILRGHFRLSSGRHSDRFVQKFRLLEDPAVLEPLARQIADAFRDAAPTIVVSAAVGGILLGYEVARALRTKAVFVEKESGVPLFRRGFHVDASDRALIVEDVITTGNSVREVIDLVLSAGAAIVGIGAIVRRSEASFGFPLHVLLEMPMESYELQACAQCRRGEPLEDPGSRRTQ